MTDLDDLDALDRLDSQGVLGAVERFAEQCREAWHIGRAARDLPEGEGVDSVVVLGMGGSGVSGDVVQAVVEPRLPVHLRTIKTYGPLPAWVGRNSLVFACSYSGSTEETLAAFSEAHDRGARIVAVSSGGQLAELARTHGVAHIAIPGGLQPRASLGYLALPLFAVLEQVGLISEMQDDVDECVEVLSEIGRRCDRKQPAGDNPAKALARRLADKVVVVYGGAGVGATAAYRFKCDVNEYAKAPAFSNELPELDHNEVVGWGRLSDLTAERFALVLLRDAEEHDRVRLRFDITHSLIEDRFADVVELSSEGRSALARLLSLVMTTQLAAIYLGLGYGIDPGPVRVIEELKGELASR